ncbi:MAG: succinylornithine transaminase family protein [Saprospiraceae bacterium]|jgi:succinylornithine transaminase family protein
MSLSEPTRSEYDQYLFPNYAPISIMPAYGKGAKLWDTENKEYIDFAAGIAVSVLGHAHPALIGALHAQAEQYWHVSNLLTTQPAIKLAKQLVGATFADKVIFSNSGAEANEAALKLARRYAFDKYGAEKNEIVAFNESFHGRTFFTVSVGGQAKYSDGFGPKPEGIRHIPYNDLDAAKAALNKNTCAVIIEPILGESGVLPAKQSFMEGLRKLCDEHNALLIFDEVQTGVMRTGHFYRYQSLGVEPDILTSAKGLGGGMPIGATLAKDEVANAFTVGVHGSTYAGNPMACAVASKVVELTNTPEMQVMVQQRSKQLFDGLKAINDKTNLFADIRGAGLLIGCELKPSHAGRAREIVESCMTNGLLVLVAGPDVLRLAPPLVVTEAEIVEGLAALEKALLTLLL